MTAPQPWIYLASKSPRRRELLRQIGVHFELISFRTGQRGEDPDIAETPFGDEPVERYVERLALYKVSAGSRRVAWRKLMRNPVLAADTSLELDDRILGKPDNAEHAVEMLGRLSGRTHRVLTAVAVTDGERTRSVLSASKVRFRELSGAEISAYVETGEPLDKAGAYGIQGRAARFVEHIEGSYSGIVGLPLFETAQLLDVFGHPAL